ncbi:ADP-ribosylation factor-like [Elysia marginata]|uniref:ADP-ribosylation factor-like n=1 Tax=Elysia marginata TaxID=1093978 RepID=A0AAV4FCS4_9GAST|nr:ADP-ribosylation factor-like [Elysia marginata]
MWAVRRRSASYGDITTPTHSADRARLEEAKEELFGIIKSPDMDRVPVVVVANKQDMPGALSTAEVADGLGLREVRDRKWYVQGACAVNGDGVFESMHEMARLVKEVYKS